jgi:hypothetical protein
MRIDVGLKAAGDRRVSLVSFISVALGPISVPFPAPAGQTVQTQLETSAPQECPDCHSLAADLEAHKQYCAPLKHDMQNARIERRQHFSCFSCNSPYIEWLHNLGKHCGSVFR